MDDSDWAFVPDPQKLTDYYWTEDHTGRLSRRKRYLLMAALGRRVAPLMTEPECVLMIELCEQFADGQIDEDTISDASGEARVVGGDAASGAANQLYWWVSDDSKLHEGVESGLDALGYVAAIEAGDLAPRTTLEEARAVWEMASFQAGRDAADRVFALDLLDIFGRNPLLPQRFSPAWRTTPAVDLARGIYDSRDFAALPILADALEEAGCDNADILTHCRGPGPHVRGCWVVDLVLGRV